MLEALHVAALLPALALILRGPDRVPSAWLLLALAFATSWVGDSLAWAFGGTWAAFYVWVPIQIGLVLLAVTERAIAFGVLLLLAVLSALLTFPGPEVLVIAVGSAAVCALVRGNLTWPVWIYFGLGTACYLIMVRDGFDMAYWYGYQAARLGAFAVFCALLWREPVWAPS
jgi:hypothetical protein